MIFYTNFSRYKGQVLLRGYEFGNRFQTKVRYAPTMYVSTASGVKQESEHRTLDGKAVAEYHLESMWEGKQFVDKYAGVEGISVYGTTNYEYACINEMYPGQIQYDLSLVAVVTLDIETDSSSGFPNVMTADKAIVAITLKRGSRIVTLGLKDYKPHLPNVEYVKCADEHELLEKFLDLWESRVFSPDVLTGWFIEQFDLPYIVNRITRLFDEETAKRLSPWKILDSRTVEIKGREVQVYAPAGIAILDYMRLYKKFSFTNQESYTLDYISEKDLGQKKVDYKSLGYTSLDDLYKRNHQLYIEYNIQDVNLVAALEDRHRFIEQVMAIAYDAKVNYEDCFTTVRMWDTIIHNYLLDHGIVVPHFTPSSRNFDIVGGYVKEPRPDLYEWVVSFDLTSLYPHLIMQYNISPETYSGKISDSYSIEQIIAGEMHDKYGKWMKEQDVNVTPNSCIYSRGKKQGFLAALMEKMFNDRNKYKKLMIEAEKEYEQTKDPEWSKKISAYHNLQLAKKIQLNSAYGALGNKYFRWFNADNAEAITTSGQLAIRWIEERMNAFLNSLLKTSGEDYVIACDTDSMYVNLDKLVRLSFGGRSAPSDTAKVIQFLDDACKKRIEPFIAKCYEELSQLTNSYQQKMHMKRESIADKALWTGKKHYVMQVHDKEGVRYDSPKIKMVGIEAVRSSTPKVCRDSIKKAINVLLNEGKDALTEYIEEFRAEFYAMPIEDVAFPRGLKGLNDYRDASSIYKKGTPIQVRGALLFNHHVVAKQLENKYQLMGDGDKIKFCYLKKPNPVHENVISFVGTIPPELKLEKYVDYELQFEKAFLDPIKTMTDVLKWDLTNSATLEDFFA